MVKQLFTFFFTLFMFLNNSGYSQIGFLQNITLTDTARRAQLLDSNSVYKNISFTIRQQSYLHLQNWYHKDGLYIDDLVFHSQRNSKLPYGDNDETMLPAVGLQARLSIGMVLKSKNWVVKLAPDFIWAENKEPEKFKRDLADPLYYPKYYLQSINRLDAFSRFGKTEITKVLPGQSFLKYQTQNSSFGISTENVWWGPGIRNSLLLTNNAPGFLHFTYESNKPFHTKWGSIEWQAIFGWLNNTNYEAPENDTMRTIWADGIAQKNKSTRLVSGFVISWQPKWVQGLYIGWANTVSWYASNQSEPNDPLGLLSSERKNIALGSFFIRYAMPNDNAEIYAEFGRGDKWATPFNLVKDTIPTGYVVGVRKLLKVGKGKNFIEINAEIARLQLQHANLIFNSANPFSGPKANSWYTDDYVAQGYSNNAQIIGAAIGPGSNSQTITINWVNGINKIGVQLERVVRNNDFYYYNYYTGIIDGGYNNRYWTDLSVGLFGQYQLKNCIIAFSINQVKALNYKWVKTTTGWNADPESDKRNYQLNLSLRYPLRKSIAR
jgi:hypothetical protein